MMKSVSKLDKAKAQVVLDHPFFSSILLKKQLTPDDNIPTLCVNPRGNIRYNPKFIDSLSVPQIVWALCHEIGHVIGQHAFRRGSRDPRKWNYAGDAWINDMLNDCNVGQPIANTVNMPGSKDKTTETIYDELPDNDGGSGGSGNPGDSGDPFDNGIGDDIDYEDMTESEKKELEAQTKIEIAQAAQAAKARGKLPGKLAEIVADIINVRTPWYDILERYMVGLTKQDYSWMRPNRRFIGNGDYLPSIGTAPQMGEVVLQVDISGSVSAPEIAYYNAHVGRIIQQCQPERVHVIYTDTDVRRHDVFERGEEVQVTYHSGGGTDMTAGFAYIEEQNINPAVVVTLTDGYTPFPDELDVPSVWCISSSVVSPVGDTVHFEMEN
jgi:predicted metal-dependent peptidase